MIGLDWIIESLATLPIVLNPWKDNEGGRFRFCFSVVYRCQRTAHAWNIKSTRIPLDALRFNWPYRPPMRKKLLLVEDLALLTVTVNMMKFYRIFFLNRRFWVNRCPWRANRQQLISTDFLNRKDKNYPSSRIWTSDLWISINTSTVHRSTNWAIEGCLFIILFIIYWVWRSRNEHTFSHPWAFHLYASWQAYRVTNCCE